MTDEIDNILDDVHSEYLSKSLTLNTSIWSTLITLHSIIIGVFALTLSLLVKKTNISVQIIVATVLVLSLVSIWGLFKNFTDCREIYDKLCYHTHRNNRDYESLKAEKNCAETKNTATKRRECFAKNSFYVESIAIFVLFYVS